MAEETKAAKPTKDSAVNKSSKQATKPAASNTTTTATKAAAPTKAKATKTATPAEAASQSKQPTGTKAITANNQSTPKSAAKPAKDSVTSKAVAATDQSSTHADDDAVAKAKNAAKLLAARKAAQAQLRAAREHLSKRDRGAGDAGKPSSGHHNANMKRSGSQKRG